MPLPQLRSSESADWSKGIFAQSAQPPSRQRGFGPSRNIAQVITHLGSVRKGFGMIFGILIAGSATHYAGVP